MLTELRVENFAIIDHLELQFDPGLITFTGETGAGKSILMIALDMLLGSRADNTHIRSGVERASVEATFHINPKVREPVHKILKQEDLLDDPQHITLAREIRRSGRNIARVNGRSVTLSLVRRLGEYLVDIHGQSEHLSLLRVREHLELLDRYAQIEEIISSYQQTFRELQSIQRELNELREREQEASRRSDLLSYQVNEIEAANLEPNEEDELLQERNRLGNAENLISLTQEALLALDEGSPENPATTDLFGQVVDALEELARLDPSQSDLSQHALSLFDGLADLNRNLRSYLDSMEFNPRRFEQVEERVSLIQSLKRKYGDTIEDILVFADEAKNELDDITHTSERIPELAAHESELFLRLGKLGQELSEKRRQAADKLVTAMEAELKDLRMSHARFKVRIQQRPDPDGLPLNDGSRVSFDRTGLDQVEFLIETNPGEGLKPLIKIASGGETSRLMLALKNVLARADNIPTLVFDEIDQGIGGRVGTIVGSKLRMLALDHQVLCITHLPQLAAFGQQHFRVHKVIKGGRMITLVEPIEGEDRIKELAQMMGEESESTLRSAQEILQTVGDLN